METLVDNGLKNMTKSELVKMVISQNAAIADKDGQLQTKEENLKSSEEKLKSSEEKLKSYEAEIKRLNAYIAELRRRIYGSKSEKRLSQDPDAIQLTLDLFSDEENAAAEQRLKEVEKQEQESLVTVAEHHRRASHRTVDYSSLDVKEKVIEPQEVMEHPDDYVLIGEETTDTLVSEPKKLYIERAIRRKYALKASIQASDSTRKAIEIAPLPKEIVFKGCLAHASTLADLVVQKFFYHIPHHRVIQQYKEAGVIISSSTVNDWFNKVCDLMLPLYNELRRHLLKSKYIHCDESAFSVHDDRLHKVANVSIWAMSDALGPDVLFQYEFGKKNNEIARKLLESYNGVVQTDASPLYEQFEKSPSKIMLGCWIHCRRYFLRSMDEDREAAGCAIAAIDRLYTIEHDADIGRLSDDQRREKRQKEAYPIIQDLETWLMSKVGKYPAKSPMSTAIGYTLTHLPKLARYVKEGWYRLDNNDIELCIRPLKVGLNNYQYCHNHDAAFRAAMMYSFIATCNKADVNPREWLEDVMPRLKEAKENADASLCQFLPGEWKKRHPDSHSMIHHITEEEHIKQILCTREKRVNSSHSVSPDANQVQK